MAINMGMYLTPDLALPFFMTEIIIAENNAVIVKDTAAKILKSDVLTPTPEKLNGIPALKAAFFVVPRAEPNFWTMPIKTPDIANKNGAATTAAKLMNMT